MALETPRCARDGCDLPPTIVVTIDGKPIAYGCAMGPHLKEFMYATRHLGDRRLIRRVGDLAAESPATMDPH